MVGKGKSVHIINGNSQYTSLMQNLGFEVTTMNRADILLFTGGADVTPSLYDHPQHPFTSNNFLRDKVEKELFDTYYGLKDFIGICRGGQFLNVMHGGTMIQHCEGHAISGTHAVVSWLDDEIYQCSSTHHQMILPAHNGAILAYSSLGKDKHIFDGEEFFITTTSTDVESVGYPHGDTGKYTICFQPHPEFFHNDMEHDCVKLFSKIISATLGE